MSWGAVRILREYSVGLRDMDGMTRIALLAPNKVFQPYDMEAARPG